MTLKVGLGLLLIQLALPGHAQEKSMNQDRKAAMAFSCVHEVQPKLSTETQQLYDYAHYHDLHNLWLPKDGVWEEMAPYYRIAAANGDYKANLRLQYLLTSNRLKHRGAAEEAVVWNNLLMQQLPATAHYKTYEYILKGLLKTKTDGAYAYLRKAADLGSADAQSAISDIILSPTDGKELQFRLQLADQFRSCAARQGNGKASRFYAMSLQEQERFDEAVRTLQHGARHGDTQSTLRLYNAFAFDIEKNPKGTNAYDLRFLNVKKDPERERRYNIIRSYLSRNDYLYPTVPDLDQIVPLPPAKLPAWDGKIAFQRWYEGPSTAKPSDALVEKLAHAQGLDPKTGLALKK